jgi:hypothetical protein
LLPQHTTFHSLTHTQGFAVKSYEAQAALHASFNQTFGTSSGNWLVPALHAVCQSTHRLAKAADEEANSADHAKLENAVTLLQESFSRTFNDRKELHMGEALNDTEGSKKIGVLFIVNELFAIYFSLNTLRLCKNLVRPVESRGLHTKGSMGDLVTYRYYTGRLNLFEDMYADAEVNLEYAFEHCHKAAIRNKKLILRYLVPVKMYRGRLPSATCKCCGGAIGWLYSSFPCGRATHTMTLCAVAQCWRSMAFSNLFLWWTAFERVIYEHSTIPSTTTRTASFGKFLVGFDSHHYIRVSAHPHVSGLQSRHLPPLGKV